MAYEILYHGFCLFMLLILYLGQRDNKKSTSGSLTLVYVMTGLMIGSDCLWEILTHSGITDEPILYFVNINYFIDSACGVYFWVRYTLKMLHSRLYTQKVFFWLLSLPAVFSVLLALTDPWTGYLFTLKEGQYFRGPLFSISAAFNLCYLIFTSVYALIRASRETFEYRRKRDLLFAFYAVPVVLSGILQVTLSVDTNCASPVLGLALIYQFGLANSAKENNDLLRAIAKSYSASFIINVDDRRIRTVSTSGEYESLEPLTVGRSYDKCVDQMIRLHVTPEDRITVRQSFRLDHVLRQLKSRNSYSLIYKIMTESGEEKYNKATFMKAFGKDGRREIFLGIELLDIRQVLLQSKDDFNEEREMLEKVKEHFTNIMANVIEARDTTSGEHVLRVKDITQTLCNRVMEDYPEYGLTPQRIRYITTGSAMHDIGKIMIPDTILLKPGRLTDEEFEIMKTHSEKGCVILDRLPAELDEEYIRCAKEICRWHHEKYDGKGYPDGLVGDEIPISAQIVSLADCFDALTTKRPYKEAYTEEEAIRMILNGECGVFNEKLISCFKKVFL